LYEVVRHPWSASSKWLVSLSLGADSIDRMVFVTLQIRVHADDAAVKLHASGAH